MSDKGIEREGRGNLTWYDAREKNPYRTEYRFIMICLCHCKKQRKEIRY